MRYRRRAVNSSVFLERETSLTGQVSRTLRVQAETLETEGYRRSGLGWDCHDEEGGSGGIVIEALARTFVF